MEAPFRKMKRFSKLFVMKLSVPSLAEPDDDGLFTREHFAPMKRLLGTADEEFLRAHGCFQQVRRTRLDHRQAYNGYLKELGDQVRRQRTLRKLAMSGSGNWDIRADMQKTFVCESALLYLRWLSWKRFLGIRVDAAAIEDCLALLLPAFRPISQAT
jgi:hypothetical protein